MAAIASALSHVSPAAIHTSMKRWESCDAEEKLGDPDVSKIIARLTRRIQGQPYEAAEVD